MSCDALKAAAIYGCTICGVAKPEQIDHHAPKNLYPLLALTPLNLVPACGLCNQGKGRYFYTEAPTVCRGRRGMRAPSPRRSPAGWGCRAS
ncbi:hypothetical protein GCM10010302_74920 [Streptomyces polychromogenes]|uniref:HNH domain-containing protein n=1 Tax=Streptomyces polychromogenes TaxID=67342 RepID=A0ABN0W560_9ACTN